MCESHLLSLKFNETKGKQAIWNCSDTLFIISNNYDGGLLQMTNHGWFSG